MRKSIWIVAVLLLCAVVMTAAVSASVQSDRESIVVTRTTMAGDPSAAEGLQVQTLLSLYRQMFWQTNYAVGAEDKAATTFRFYQKQQPYPGEIGYGDFYVQLASKNCGISGWFDLDDWNLPYDVLLEPVKALAAQTDAGEIRTEVLRVGDYYAYYPLTLDPISHMVDGYAEVRAAHNAFLRTYFQIPVYEHDYVEVTVEKDGAGRVVDVDMRDWYPEEAFEKEVLAAPCLFSDTVVTEHWGYLLLSGNVDLSQSKGGYGLYRIPITWHEQWENTKFFEPVPHLELEQMETVYPMDSAYSENVSLEPGLDETELLVFSDSEDGMCLTVLSTEDFSVRQQVALNTNTVPRVWSHEDLLILGYEIYDTDHSLLQVLQRQDGQYAFWLQTELYPLTATGSYPEPVFAFDGQRLAIACHQDDYLGGAHRITVYDRGGLLYTADTAYDSDTLPDAPKHSYREDTLQISWSNH